MSVKLEVDGTDKTGSDLGRSGWDRLEGGGLLGRVVPVEEVGGIYKTGSDMGKSGWDK